MPLFLNYGLALLLFTSLWTLTVMLNGAAMAAVARAARRAVLAYFFLGERLTLVQLAGSLLILGAVVLLRIREGRLAVQIASA